MDPQVWDEMLNAHQSYFEEQIPGKSRWGYAVAIFLVLAGVVCTILYFTKWRKEDEENKKTK